MTWIKNLPRNVDRPRSIALTQGPSIGQKRVTLQSLVYSDDLSDVLILVLGGIHGGAVGVGL